ncbi:MAG: hypothetical protein ACRDZP_08405 [Acidimicrobiales bacterium]
MIDDVGARNNLRRRFGRGPSADYDCLAELSRSSAPYGGLVHLHLRLDALDTADQLCSPALPGQAPSGVRAHVLNREGPR